MVSRRVRDDPQNPDPGFAELYARLADAGDLEPWLTWCRRASGPVLYLGPGTGRLAVPLGAAGIDVVGVDAHPGMLAELRRRAPGIELHQALIETMDLGRRFSLVIGPSSICGPDPVLAAAVRHLEPGGRLGFELMNPHWLLAAGHPRVRTGNRDGDHLDLEVDYGNGYTQEARVTLRWPEDVEARLAGHGLALVSLAGLPGAGVRESSTYFVLAEAAGR